MSAIEGIDFVTLGMFIIDEIEYLPPKPPVKDILGGAGTYSALGARLLSPPPLSQRVSWIVDCGSDFPSTLKEIIDGWRTNCLMRQTPDRLTTRGWNGYGANEFRSFKYLTPKLRLDEDALSAAQLRSKSFHLICSPLRCISLINGILRRRRESANLFSHPIFIWEPVPDVCTPEEMGNCAEALRLVDYVSPNHEELAAFFGTEAINENNVDREAVELMATEWLAKKDGVSALKAVIVRCGKDGCVVVSNNQTTWLPAFHQDSTKVVDPTGGGNTFLGGLAVGLARGETPERAALWGTVAASFAIEQIGMPRLDIDAGEDTWNGENVQARLLKYTNRINAP